MKRLLATELLKLRTIRSPWLLLAGTQLLVVAGVAGVVASGEDVRLQASVTKALAHVGLASVLSLLLGIIAMAGEHGHGTIVDTYLVTPRRSRVLAAKLVVYAGAGAVIGVLAGVTALVVTVAAFSAKGGSVDLSSTETWRTLAGAVAWNIAFAAMGVSIGALVRNVVGAVAAALAWIALVEGLVGQLVGDAASRWLPFASGLALGGANPAGTTQLSQGAAVAALAVYAVGLAIAARSLTLERDVT